MHKAINLLDTLPYHPKRKKKYYRWRILKGFSSITIGTAYLFDYF